MFDGGLSRTLIILTDSQWCLMAA